MNDILADRILMAYEEYERRFAEFLRVVPYDAHNKDSWSPLLVDLLLGVCGLLDSMFRHISPDLYKPKAGKPIKHKDLNITHYREQFSCDWRLDHARTLVLISPPKVLRPFQVWHGGTESAPDWWKLYNDVKHDRLNKMHLGTADAALEALCGMFTAAASYPPMYPILLRRGWTHTAGVNPTILLEDLSTPRRWQHPSSGSCGSFLAYTSLFVTSLGPTLLSDRPEDIQPVDFRPVDRLMVFLGKGF
jgi:hypothetical protein